MTEERICIVCKKRPVYTNKEKQYALCAECGFERLAEFIGIPQRVEREPKQHRRETEQAITETGIEVCEACEQWGNRVISMHLIKSPRGARILVCGYCYGHYRRGNNRRKEQIVAILKERDALE